MYLSIRRERSRWVQARLMAVPVFLGLGVAGCASLGSEVTPQRAEQVAEAVAEPVLAELPAYPGVTVREDEQYGDAGGEDLMLDVCLPPEDAAAKDVPRAAVVSIHGGSWTRGDKV